MTRLTADPATARMLSARFQALARRALPREVRVAHGAPAARARAFRGHAALQRALSVSATTGRPTRRRARSELKSYADAARFFNPMLVTFTGGEPTLRRDLEDLVAEVDRAISLKYVTLITHGAMLTPGARAVAVGRGRQSVQHLARLSRRTARPRARHSRACGEDPRARSRRCARAASTTFDSTPSSRTTTSTRSCPSSLARRQLGVGVNFSVYTDAKNGNRDYLIGDRGARAARRRRATAARVQAAPARRDHQLRLLPRADSALSARRDARALPVGHPHDPHRSRRPGEALPRLPDRFSLARFPATTNP